MTVVGLDTETKLISYPGGVCPDMVCTSLYWDDGTGELLHTKDPSLYYRLKDMLVESTIKIVGQNIAFDMHVILKRYPDLWPQVWGAYKQGRIHDTMLREQLMNNTRGELVFDRKNRRQYYSLAALTKKYVGIEISGKEDGWRFRYGELLNTPITHWEKEAVDYAMDDAKYTYQVYMAQEEIKMESGAGSIKSENIQVMAAFALTGVQNDGIRIDQKQVDKIEDRYADRFADAKRSLQVFGIMRPDGTICKAHRDRFAKMWGVDTYTEKGNLSCNKETLNALNCDRKSYKSFMTYQECLSTVRKYIPQLRFDRLHPRYSIIKKTLRTSCTSTTHYKDPIKSPYPSTNFQNLPGKDLFRNCVVPDNDKVLFCTVDYGGLEQVTGSQAMIEELGYSHMGDMINQGISLHDALGCELYNYYKDLNLSLDEYIEVKKTDPEAKSIRSEAKPFNLGAFGGLGHNRIWSILADQGRPNNNQIVNNIYEMVHGRYPEVGDFFDNVLPQMKNAYGNKYSFDVLGIWFGDRSYTEASNGFTMQIRAAIGAKLAFIRLYEECTNPELGSVLYQHKCKFKGFVHDENIMQVPELHYDVCEDRICLIMMEEMQRVCPNMRISVESTKQRKWGKTGLRTKEFYLKPKVVACTN